MKFFTKRDWQLMIGAVGTLGVFVSLIGAGPTAWAVVEPIAPATHSFVRGVMQGIQVAMAGQLQTEHDATAMQLTKLEQLVNQTHVDALNTSLAVLEGQLAALEVLMDASPNDTTIRTQITAINDQIESTKKQIGLAECNLAASGQSLRPCQ